MFHLQRACCKGVSELIAVIDYGVGNLFSVEKALLYLGADVSVTSSINDIKKADKLVLPGVGAFGDCMKNLDNTGLVPVILDEISNGKPLLGICVGLQILFEGSEESPGVKGLGIIPGVVRKIKANGLKVPHMGWNNISLTEAGSKSALFKGLDQKPYMYFVHSYYAVPQDSGFITAETEYGSRLTAAVKKGNVQAVQFHPEKSGDTGLRLLENFIDE